MANLAYGLDYVERYETIEGVKNIMAPSAVSEHFFIDTNLVVVFGNYCRRNKCGVVFGDIDVHLPDGNNVFRPDVMIIRDRNIIKSGGAVYGTPDLVVEILSPSTAKNDMGVKKDAYEKNGVKEYWIVNHVDKSVQVYHLIDGKFNLDYVYHVYTDQELEMLEESERSEIKNDIKVSIFDDLIVDVADVFYDI